MASPTVEHRGTDTQSGATQNYTIPGGALSAGELLVVVLGNAAGTESAMGFDTGWNSTTQTNQGNDAGIIIGWYYSSSGGETTFDITAGSGTETFAMMYVLSGAADPATQAPDTGGGANGDSDSRNPPSVSITDGPEDVLVIAGWAQEGGATGGQPSTPSNYSNALYQEASAQPDAGGSAERALNTSSEDPGAFTGGTTDNWAADTIAIHPTGATAVDVTLSTATSTVSAQALDLSLSPFSASLTPATLSVVAQSLDLSLTALETALTPATLQVAAQALGVELGEAAIEISLSPATLQATAQALDVDIARLIALEPATLSIVARAFTPGIGVAVSLDPATIQVVAQALDTELSAKSVSLDPATLNLAAQILTLSIAEIVFNAGTFERRIHSRLGEHGLAYTEGKIVFICEDDEVHETNFVYGNFSKVTCSHGVGIKPGSGDGEYALFRKGTDYPVTGTERTILEDAGYSIG